MGQHNEPEKRNLAHEEGTLLRMGIKLLLAKGNTHVPKVLQVVRPRTTKYEDVVEVNNDKLPNVGS